MTDAYYPWVSDKSSRLNIDLPHGHVRTVRLVKIYTVPAAYCQSCNLGRQELTRQGGKRISVFIPCGQSVAKLKLAPLYENRVSDPDGLSICERTLSSLAAMS